MFFRKHSTIRYQLTCLVVACVLPVWLVAGYLVWHAYTVKLDEVNNSVLTTARSMTMIVDRELTSVQASLQALATSSSFRKGDLEDIHRQVMELLKSYPGADIIVADASGQQLVNSFRPFGAPLPKRNNPAMVQKIFASGKPQVSNLFFGAVTRRPLVGIDVPVFRDGKVVYDLSMTFSSERMAAILLNRNLPEGWYSTILDNERVIVTRSKDSGKYTGKQVNARLSQAMSAAAEGVLENSNIAGVPVFVGFSQSSASGWAVAVGVPKDVVLNDIYRWMAWAIGSATTISLVGILLALGIAGRIARAIRSLVSPALAIGRGESVTGIGSQAVKETFEVAKALAQASELLQRQTETMREQQQSLQQNEKKYRIVADNTYDWEFWISPEHRFVYSSPTSKRITGYEAADFLADPELLERIIHPEDRDLFKAYLNHVEQHVGVHETEFRMIRRDGAVRWVAHLSRPIYGDDGDYLGLRGNHRDITEQKRVEAELLQSEERYRNANQRLKAEVDEREAAQADLAGKQQQLEEINRSLGENISKAVSEIRQKDQVMIAQSRQAAMGEMIGNIAHQWRQPLNALGLLLANIKDAYDFNELDSDYLNSAVADGNRLVQKMSVTINDFRNFFNPGKEQVVFSARQQISEAIALVAASFKNDNIRIHLEASPDLRLFGFPNEYSQVLLNLLSNARDAMKASGAVSGLIRINLAERDGQGCVTVTDSGGGIRAESLDRIFEPYFSTKERGTGIGLYMSKMIIERNMQGSIAARNVEGGAEFTILTPLAKPATQALG
jgi:PAS domain S-box-containing protein